MRLLNLCFPGEQVYGAYGEEIVDFLESAPSAASHLVFKTHCLTTVSKTLARTQSAKVVYTWRDPADAIVSCMRLAGIDFEMALQLIRGSLKRHAFHAQTGNAVIIAYNEVLASPGDVIERIARYLQLRNLSSSIIDEVAQHTSFERMRERTREIDKKEDSTLIETFGMRQDPETLLFRNHIQDGGCGYGRTMLTSEQLELVGAEAEIAAENSRQ